jgi:hypothetical protein
LIILIHDLMQYSNLPDELKSPALSNEYPNTGPLTVTFSLPSGISEEDRTSGVLSQPLSYDGTFTSSLFDGILSMPIFPKLQEEFLINDIGEFLIDDLGNNLTGLFFPSEYTIDPATRIITDDLFFDGFLSQPMTVIGTNEFDCLGIGGTDASELTINGSVTITSDDGLSFKDGLYRLPQILQAGVITIEHNGTYLGRLACGTCRRMCISPSREPGFYTNIRPRETLSGQRIAAAGGYGGQIIGVDFRYKIDRDIYTDFQLAYNTQIMQGFPFFIDFENDDWLPMNKFYGYTDNNLLFQSSVNYFRYSRRFEFKQAF